MNIESLKIFCDLIQEGSFSTTAERNGMTQSAVSQKIRALEQHFNATLIERGRHCLKITPEGEAVLKAAKEIVEIFERAHREIEQLQSHVKGSLRVSTVLTIGIHELPVYIARFRDEFPEVDLQINYRRSHQVYADIIEGRADLGLVAYPQRRKGIVVHSFWKDRLVAICPPEHPLAKRKMVSPKDLAGLDFIGFHPDLPSSKALDNMFKKAGIRVEMKMEFDNVETVKNAVALSPSVAIVPLRSVSEDVERGRLKALMLNDPDCWRPLGILGKRNRAMTPPMREFIRVLTHGRQNSSVTAFPQSA